MGHADLGESVSRATIGRAGFEVPRQSLEPDDRPVPVTAPDGTTTSLTLRPDGGGRSTATQAISQMGMYRVSDGSHTALAAAGHPNPLQFTDVRASPLMLRPPSTAIRREGVFSPSRLL